MTPTDSLREAQRTARRAFELARRAMDGHEDGRLGPEAVRSAVEAWLTACARVTEAKARVEADEDAARTPCGVPPLRVVSP